MPDDVILRSRLRILGHNLEEVKNVIHAVESVRASLQRVILTWESNEFGDVKLKLTLDDIAEKLSSVRGAQQSGSASANKLDEALAGVNQIKSKLCSEEIIDAVRAIRARSMDLHQTELRSTIEYFLVRNASQRRRAIELIEAALDADLADPDEEVRARAAKKAWAGYLRELPRAQAVFAEYVDFLGGLALRDAGYDQGICRIADELVHAFGRLGDLGWNSLTIPARRDALDMTMLRIIRIGFPEWTVWSLPLVAYGFGSVLVGTIKEFTEFTDGFAENRRAYVRVLLADAFATCVMGPAYACALLLLRLDPAAPEEPGAEGLALMRAEVVLEMLRRTSEEADERPYHQIHERLRKQWESAVRQTGERAGERRAEIDVPALVGFVADELYRKELNPKAWSRIDRWSRAMLVGKVLSSDDVDRIDDSLTYVLNAVWLARLRQDMDPQSSYGVDGDDEAGASGQVDLAGLAMTAREYWAVIDDAQRRAASQTLGGQYVPARGGR